MWNNSNLICDWIRWIPRCTLMLFVQVNKGRLRGIYPRNDQLQIRLQMPDNDNTIIITKRLSALLVRLHDVQFNANLQDTISFNIILTATGK